MNREPPALTPLDCRLYRVRTDLGYEHYLLAGDFAAAAAAARKHASPGAVTDLTLVCDSGGVFYAGDAPCPARAVPPSAPTGSELYVPLKKGLGPGTKVFARSPASGGLERGVIERWDTDVHAIVRFGDGLHLVKAG